MLNNVIIAADLRPNSPNRAIALGLYCVLERTDRKPAFLSTGDQLKLFKEEEYKHLNTVSDISTARNSFIILLREVKNYYEIDRSNKVIYYAAGPLIDYFISFILPRVDVIITTNYALAFRLIAICKQTNINIPVYRMSPFYDIDQLPLANNSTGTALVVGEHKILDSLNRYDKLKYEILGNQKLINGKKIENVQDLTKYNYLIYTGNTNDNLVYEAMLSGLIVIAPNRLPFNEIIVDSINGYLMSSEEDIGRALSNDESLIITNLVSMRNNFNYGYWIEQLISTINGAGAQDVRDVLGDAITPMRRWIIPKMILQGDEEVKIPSIYDKNSFKMIDEQDIEYILTFFASQPFRDVYVFGWEFGQKEITRVNRIKNLIRALGSRILNIYWCTDIAIQGDWSEIFNGLSIITTTEGLKRVRPL